MRNWIDLFEHPTPLYESWFAMATVLDGKHIDLFSNPSRAEWTKLFRDHPQGLRGHVLRGSGAVIVWDAMTAVHSDVEEYLQAHGHQITCGYRYFYPDRIEFNDLQMEINDEDLVNEAGKVTHYGFYVRETFDTTVANRSITAFYGNPPKILGIDYLPILITAEWIKANCAIRT